LSLFGVLDTSGNISGFSLGLFDLFQSFGINIDVEIDSAGVFV
jgi:hypothetical protein